MSRDILKFIWIRIQQLRLGFQERGVNVVNYWLSISSIRVSPRQLQMQLICEEFFPPGFSIALKDKCYSWKWGFNACLGHLRCYPINALSTWTCVLRISGRFTDYLEVVEEIFCSYVTSEQYAVEIISICRSIYVESRGECGWIRQGVCMNRGISR